MSTLSIKTNQLKTRKKVEIDGHPYTVRRLGNIERMDLSQYMRRLDTLVKKEQKAELSAAEKQEVEKISTLMSEMFIAQFDDGGDQTKSRALVSSLSDEEINILLSKIFTENGDGETES